MKASGHDIVAFFTSEWPEHYYVDDSELTACEDGIFAGEDVTNLLPLEDKYELDRFGFLCSTEGPDAKVPSLATYFKRWNLARTHITISITLPKEDETAVRQYLATIPTVKIL